MKQKGMVVQDNSTEVIDGIEINKNLSQGPFFVDGCDTLPKLFLKRCLELQKKVAHREKDLGIWNSFSWTDYYQHVRLIGLGLHSLGLKRNDTISIISEGRKEWIYTDIAAQCMGAVCSGVYTTDSAQQLSYQLSNSDSIFLFLDTDEQLDKLLSIIPEVPKLVKAIVYDRKNLDSFNHDKVIFMDELYSIGREFLSKNSDFFENEVGKSKPEDVAIIVYTSGTTGAPKGAMITQENLLYAGSTQKHLIRFFPSDELFCFLPLCHIYERTTSGLNPIMNKTTVNFAESIETVFENLQEVSPMYFAGVPRIYEKIHSNFTLALSEATNLSKWIYGFAIWVGLKKVELDLEQSSGSLGVNLLNKIFDFLVFRNLRRMLGFDRITKAVTGAAPISPDLIKWYLAIGVPIVEGYGMTETAAAMTVNIPENNRVGTVGRLYPGSHVRIADDGEIQFNSPSVFKGYYKNRGLTAEVFTNDGWFKTGDQGSFENNFLKITGRIKDIIITDGGKNIAPAEIENALKFSKFIADAMVIGDSKKSLTALILIDQENVERHAQENRIQYSDFNSLCKSDKIKKLIDNEVQKVNDKVARVEQIKKFRLIDVLLTADDDEMTATMKLKRGIVEKKYKSLINSMYK